MNQCTNQTLLPKGTEVYVKDMKGVVEDCELAKDQFGYNICLHTIRYTHKHVSAVGGMTWMPLTKDRVEKCNYSFIFYK